MAGYFPATPEGHHHVGQQPVEGFIVPRADPEGILRVGICALPRHAVDPDVPATLLDNFIDRGQFQSGIDSCLALYGPPSRFYLLHKGDARYQPMVPQAVTAFVNVGSTKVGRKGPWTERGAAATPWLPRLAQDYI
jgi:hypothetical protein